MRTGLVTLSTGRAFGLLMLLFAACAGPRASGITASEEGATADAEPAARDSLSGRIEKVVLSEHVTYPMELDIAPDGRVFFVERDGSLKVWDPETGQTLMAGFIPVTSKIEDGLLGLSLDPNFAENQWLYLYYAPLDEGPNTLSRFTMKGNALDVGSEIEMLEVPVQRLRCCHSAGSTAFDAEGNLYLSTGENGGGWNRTGELVEGLYGWDAYWDNERSTANTNDLRGKILRIRPQEDGTYTIPAGNLFEDDDPRTRPEIYTMGHRNPWRISVDGVTGWLYWGDVGPGNQPDPERAPPGWEEMNQARAPGFFGWPQFVGPNDPYRDEHPETEALLEWADPDRPINDSPNNTGIQALPPAQPAWIWYMYGPSEEFPEVGSGGMSAAVGPVYHYDPDTVGPHGLPEVFDERVFIYEFMRHWVMEVELDEDGMPGTITRFAPDFDNIRPIDLELGPDGRLYMLEWGTDFWGQNRDAKLVRYDYYASSDVPRLAVPETVNGGSRPRIAWPPDGGFFDYGQAIPYAVQGDDRDIAVQPYLAHDTHVHPLLRKRGPRGVVQVLPDFSHAPYVVAEYVELEAVSGQGSSAPAAADPSRIRLNPKRLQAENNTASEGAQLVVTANRQRPTFPEETEVFLEMEDGSYVVYEPIDFHGVDSLSVRLVPDAPGSVEVRVDAPDGTLLAEAAFDRSADMPAPEEDEDDRTIAWTNVRVPIADPGGARALYVVFRGPEQGPVARFDRVDVVGKGVMDVPAD